MPKSTEEIYKDLLAQGQGYQQQADSLLEQINNRPAFSYNAETDPMFQSVKNQYVHQGQRAMQDTMGQAAGLTGGYGSSYAQAVGNQAYNEYLTQLNAQIPVLAQQARAAYDAEGQDLRDRYALALNADRAFARQFGGEKISCPYIVEDRELLLTAAQWSEYMRLVVDTMNARVRQKSTERVKKILRGFFG